MHIQLFFCAWVYGAHATRRDVMGGSTGSPHGRHNTNGHTQTTQQRRRDGRTSHHDSGGAQPGRARRGQPTCVPRPRDTFTVPHGGTDVADEDDLTINCRGSETTPQRHNVQAHGGDSTSCDLEHDEAAAAATPTTPSAFGKTCGKTWEHPRSLASPS